MITVTRSAFQVSLNSGRAARTFLRDCIDSIDCNIGFISPTPNPQVAGSMSQGQIMGKQAALIRELLFKMLDCQFSHSIHKLVNFTTCLFCSCRPTSLFIWPTTVWLIVSAKKYASEGLIPVISKDLILAEIFLFYTPFCPQVRDTLVMGSPVLLPALEERMLLLNTLLPERWDTLSPGHSLQLTLVLNSFLEDCQVTQLLGEEIGLDLHDLT